MKIIYCHHAQRDQDKSKPQNLRQGEGLTPLGIEDATIYAKMLKQANVKLNAIYTSPFFRCVSTANIINEQLNTNIITDDRFNEFGSIENESWETCQTRIMSALKDIIKKHDNSDIVLCITSGVNIGAFICLAYGIKPDNNNPFLGITSCSPIVFDFDKEKGNYNG